MFDKNTNIDNEKIIPAGKSMNKDWFKSFTQRVKNDQDNIIKNLGPQDLINPSDAIMMAANTLTVACYQNERARVYIDVFSSKYDAKILNFKEVPDLAILFRNYVLDSYYDAAIDEKFGKNDLIIPTTIKTLNKIEKIYKLDGE